jgi:hypothetical protein
MEIAATAVEKTTARVRDIAVVPQLPEMDLRRSAQYTPQNLALPNFVEASLMRTAGSRRPFSTC